REPVVGGGHSDLLSISTLEADVRLRRRVVTHKESGEMRPRQAGCDARSDTFCPLGQDRRRHLIAVDANRRHWMPSSRRPASAASLMTRATSPPRRRQSSYSGATPTGRPSSSFTFTRTLPSPVSTSITRLPATIRDAAVI